MQNNLIRLRKEAGLSQEELADKLAVSRQAVSKWERGEALPDTDNLIRLARLYNVSIDEIVGYAPEKETSADENKVAGADGAKETDNASGADGAKATDNASGADGANDDGNADGEHDGEDDGEDDEYFTQDGETKKYHSKTKGGKHIRFETDGKQKRIIISDDDDDMDSDDYPRRRTRLCDVLDGVYTILCVVAFFVWGAVFNGWEIAWTLFITIPIFTSIVACVRKKRVGKFNFPCFVAFVYLLFGMIFNIWHPIWIIFLLVPAFYPIARVIDSSIKDKERRKN